MMDIGNFNATEVKNEQMKGLRPFQRIVKLYRERNPLSDEMKYDSSCRHTLAGYKSTLASCLRFRGQRR